MEFGALSEKYQGEVAASYEARRADDKWHAENQTARELLAMVPTGLKTLDAPVGTGRLIPLLAERRYNVTGLDVSADMLNEARKQADAIGARMELVQGDIRHIPFPEEQFDLVSCLRFLNWIDEKGVREVLSELARVSRSHLLVGVRYETSLSELGFTPRDVVSRVSSHLGLATIRTRSWGLHVHKRSILIDQFERLNLSIQASRRVERRWDGTDYVFFLLRKS